MSPTNFLVLLDNNPLTKEVKGLTYYHGSIVMKDNCFIYYTPLTYRFTIGYWVEGDRLLWSIAICNPRDRFVKKIGRDIVRGRFASGMFNSCPLPSDRRTNLPLLISYVRQAIDNNDGDGQSTLGKQELCKGLFRVEDILNEF